MIFTQSPVTNHQSPITNHQSPITNHQSPVTSHQSPVTNHQSPPDYCQNNFLCYDNFRLKTQSFFALHF
ncbi:MAG: hypothetical protein ACKPEO_19285 [Sphaerospermopsis kisseleviana]